MDILSYIIEQTQEDGNGTVAYLKDKKGTLHLIGTVYPEHDITLYVVPKDKWKKLEKFFDSRDTDACGDPVEEDITGLFWAKMSKYNVGDFEGN